MLFNLWLNKTDSFLCNNVKNIFEEFEESYKNKNQQINLFQELQHLTSDPLVSANIDSTDFERDVKLKLKFIIGIFFVFIPLLSFMFLSYIMDVSYAYAIFSTFAVAIFASSRVDIITLKYSDFRHSLI